MASGVITKADSYLPIGSTKSLLTFPFKLADPFSSQLCLWTTESGQAECLQGGAMFTYIPGKISLVFVMASFTTRPLAEGILALQTLGVSSTERLWRWSII